MCGSISCAASATAARAVRREPALASRGAAGARTDLLTLRRPMRAAHARRSGREPRAHGQRNAHPAERSADSRGGGRKDPAAAVPCRHRALPANCTRALDAQCAARAAQPRPEWPKPPAPRALAAKSSTTSAPPAPPAPPRAARCARPGSIVKGCGAAVPARHHQLPLVVRVDEARPGCRARCRAYGRGRSAAGSPRPAPDPRDEWRGRSG